MTNTGVLASRFEINSKTLKEFDNALNSIKRETEITKKEDATRKLLEVIDPISQRIQGNLSPTTSLSELSITDFLEKMHNHDWSSFKERLLELRAKLCSGHSERLSKAELDILEDIADAIDAKCESLFQRMRL